MKIPPGMTEEQVIEVITRISNKLSYKFTFGPYTRQDIAQEAFILGLKGLDKHDGIRPLENFLWRHIHNRLCNFKRDNFIRHIKPCHDCPLDSYIKSTGVCTAYDDVMKCKWYASWHKKTSSKRNIMSPIEMSCVSDEKEENMYNSSDINSDTFNKDIVRLLDKNIDIALRPTWLKMKSGTKVSKHFREKLKENILEILKENNIDPETWQA
jgi:hypothetical protein